MEPKTEEECRDIQENLRIKEMKEIKAFQTSLNGVWRTMYGGCPHLHRGDVDLCDANADLSQELRPCVYDVGRGPCKIFEDILAEWRLDLGICHCGTKLESCSGQDGIPAHLFCPKCMDYAYDQASGQVIGTIE